MEHRQINGRDVFLVDAHHEVLAAWAQIRARLEFPPHLLSFDSHTDSHRAFMRHLQLAWDSPNLVQRGAPLVDQIRYDNPASISHAIQLLAHDEHIDCALRSGIIDRVFIFLGAMSAGITLAGATVFEDLCLPNCPKECHDDDCLRLLADHVLEPELLRPHLDVITTDLGRPIEDTSYILDIDLDFFLTRRAASPAAPSLFRLLILHAKAITIAREQGCVEDLRLEGENITADDLEALVLDQICEAQVERGHDF